MIEFLYDLNDEDADFLRGRGFDRLPGRLPHGDVTLLGEVAVDDVARIKLSVCAMPARFWEAQITPSGDAAETLTLTTGNGLIAEYWPTFELFARNLLGVESGCRACASQQHAAEAEA